MMKKLCVSGAVLAAAIGIGLSATPAHAAHDDTYIGNWSRYIDDSAQSGNQFGNIRASNRGCGNSVNVNSVSATSCRGNISVTYVFD
ncbi:hypothetical protein [Rhizohabitans arisaemae]|uniref:hypothetical protein n=1 Tax=Rhizohabitans arisaemae TaxID=2720610 RepID=UPI0024B1749E|nr:hypothetical protein [Rhizohabitans arisaemae]